MQSTCPLNKQYRALELWLSNLAVGSSVRFTANQNWILCLDKFQPSKLLYARGGLLGSIETQGKFKLGQYHKAMYGISLHTYKYVWLSNIV